MVYIIGIPSLQKRWTMDNGNKVVNEIKLNGVSSKKTLEKSFVEVVVGSHSGVPKRITINAFGNEWLSRSVVARLNSLSTMDSIREALHCKGVPQIEVRDMGGLWVVLSFPSPELMLSVFDWELKLA